ncbi:hypothetical protein BLNAU_14963 [Blattamonas nauphoetae]|uniref:Uncharacterized protein n=1 Tax=Blattamonas nauphoetae TaxID=2049346 RepID=A0ABQ9X7K1_9EUKA|nr:hypothetical protein BLNAU_18656 [Blattamonas nauphoetae]KAK2950161.1 hypothetical protein BLNAU_14963 [Blattamonas nauphoetae]
MVELRCSFGSLRRMLLCFVADADRRDVGDTRVQRMSINSGIKGSGLTCLAPSQDAQDRRDTVVGDVIKLM